MDGNKYRVVIKTPRDAPAEYHKYQLEAGRRQAGNNLYDILVSQKLPAVVDIKEVVTQSQSNNYFDYYLPENELRIEIEVTPVQHKHITFAHAETWQPIALIGKHPVKQAIGRLLNSIGRLIR